MEKELKVVINLQDNMSSKMPNVTGSIIKAELALGALKASAGLAFSALEKAFSFGKSALDTAVAYEQNAIAFKSLVGNLEDAKTLLKDVAKFAEATPFELPEVQEGAKRLLAYNVSAKELIPTFKMLGNISLGNTQKMNSLILAYGQARAANKLTGAEMRQFTEAGVPLIDMLARYFNVASSEIQDMVSDGKVSFDILNEVLKRSTEQGGLFFNTMEDQANSLGGVWSNISDGVTRIQLSLMGLTLTGDAVKGGFFEKIKNGSIELKENMTNLSNVINTEVSPKIGQFIDKMIEIGNKIYERVKPSLEELDKAIKNDLMPTIKDLNIDWKALEKIMRENIIVTIEATVKVLKELIEWTKEHKKEIQWVIDNGTKYIQFWSSVYQAIFKVAGVLKDINDLLNGKNLKKLADKYGFGIISNTLDDARPSRAHGGFTPGSAYDSFPTLLHGGERVIPRNGTDVNNTQTSNITVNFNGSIGQTTQQDLNSIVQAVKSAINRENLLYSQGAY